MKGEGFFFDPSFDDEYLIVAPVGFMVVYCGEDQTDLDLPSLTPLMTSFSIDADGDVLAL